MSYIVTPKLNRGSWFGVSNVLPSLKNQANTTLFTTHPEIFWLKDMAKANIPNIFITDDTFHELRGWSNDVAFRNILSINLTRNVSQELRGWLNAVAPRNIPLIFVISVVTILLNGTGDD